jgi:hypothetical protein
MKLSDQSLPQGGPVIFRRPVEKQPTARSARGASVEPRALFHEIEGTTE